MTKILLYVFTAISLYGCSFIAKRVYGAREPKIENQHSIIAWLQNHELPTEDVVTLDTNEYFNFLPIFTTSPLLFESNGKFRAAGYTNGKYCPTHVDRYLSNLNSAMNGLNSLDSFIVKEFFDVTNQDIKFGRMNRHKLNELRKTVAIKDTITPNFFELSSKFYSLDGTKHDHISSSNYDFILVLPFAKFFGQNFQVKDLKNYYQATKNNQNTKFRIIFLNLDKQEWWGKEANDKINISL